MATFYNLTSSVRYQHIFKAGNLISEDLNDSQIIKAELSKALSAKSIQPGIVSVTDPVTNSGSLSVLITGRDTFSLNPGSAVFQDGIVFNLTDLLNFQIDLPTVEVGYILALVKTLASSTTRYNKTTEMVDVVEQAYEFKLQLFTTDDFYLTDRYTTLVMAYVGLQPSPFEGFTFLTSTDPVLNRTWFSTIDYIHRGQVGTGVVSGSNPHGLSMSDLDILPGLSFWQQQGMSGVITNFSGSDLVRGDLVTQTITLHELVNNVSGGPTTFTLPKGAAKVLMVKEGNSTYLNYTYNSSTRTITCYPVTPIVAGLTVIAIIIHAGTVTKKTGSEVSVEAPIDGEFFVSENKTWRILNDQDIALQNLAGAANSYELYASELGTVILNPASILRTDIIKIQSTTLETITLENSEVLKFAIYNFIVPTISWSIKLLVKGLDSNNVVLQEELTFSGDGSVGLPGGLDLTFNYENEVFLPEQWVSTTNKFASITDIQVVNVLELPTSTSFLITQAVSLSELVPLALVNLSSKGSIVDLLDLREQKIYSEKINSYIFYEDFYNPLAFNPEKTSSIQNGLVNGLWTSIPVQLMVGNYVFVLHFDTISFTGGSNLGSELLGSTGWTIGPGTTGPTGTSDWTPGTTGSGEWIHTPDNDAPLLNSVQPVINTQYHLGWTVTDRTAGHFDISFGHQTINNQFQTGFYTPTATTTESLAITPTVDFDGTVVFSLKAVQDLAPAVYLSKDFGTTPYLAGQLQHNYFGSSKVIYNLNVTESNFYTMVVDLQNTETKNLSGTKLHYLALYLGDLELPGPTGPSGPFGLTGATGPGGIPGLGYDVNNANLLNPPGGCSTAGYIVAGNFVMQWMETTLTQLDTNVNEYLAYSITLPQSLVLVLNTQLTIKNSSSSGSLTNDDITAQVLPPTITGGRVTAVNFIVKFARSTSLSVELGGVNIYVVGIK